ncbi:MAG: ECF-type sigma factor [Marinicellaceae bacterium]
MIKFTRFSAKILAIASYYVRFFHQSGKFSLFFLSSYSYAKLSIKLMHELCYIKIMPEIQDKKPEKTNDLDVVLYNDLRHLAHKLMMNERNNHTLSATDLVHEAYVKLSKSDLVVNNEKHYFRTLAKQMRRVLIDYGRSKSADKKKHKKVMIDYTGALGVIDSTPDFSLIDKAINELFDFDQRSAEAIDLVYFTNLSQIKAAKYLDVSLATLERDIKFGRAFINNFIKDQ